MKRSSLLAVLLLVGIMRVGSAQSFAPAPNSLLQLATDDLLPVYNELNLQIRAFGASLPGVTSKPISNNFNVRENRAIVSIGTAPQGKSPSQIRKQYGFDLVPLDGSGQTIAVVAFGTNPSVISADVQAFNRQFGLPDLSSLVVVDSNGGTNFPPVDSIGAMAASANVQWVHAIAPGAKVLVVVGATGTLTDMLRAYLFAKNQDYVSVVLNSWGADEFLYESVTDSQNFEGTIGKTFVAAGRDNGGLGVITGYPAISALSLSVGGTALTCDATGTRLSESAWNGNAGGPSQGVGIKRPTFQAGFPNYDLYNPHGRAMPDISLDAAPGVGYSVSYNNQWLAVSGSGQSAAVAAAMVAIINHGRALTGKKPIDGPTELLPQIYGALKTNFNDITTGRGILYNAEVGYDLATGWGSPQVAKFASDLTGLASVSLTSSVSQQNVGQSVTFTASVLPFASGVFAPTGTVVFMDGSVALGTVTIVKGAASLSTSGLSAGSHNITVQYSGDKVFQKSTSAPLALSVKVPTTTSLTASSTTVKVGTAVSFKVVVSASDPSAGTPTGTVQIFDGTAVAATIALVNGAGTFSTSNLTKGTHAFKCSYIGSDTFGTSSTANSVNITVTK